MLLDLHQQRERAKAKISKRARTRGQLTAKQRELVLSKTDCRCHICGGSVEGEPWQADHVLARSGGGAHDVDNYLPAHSLCNNYRWDYLSEEFKWILKIGVWTRTQIEMRNALGLELAKQFMAYEKRRVARRRRRPS
jgi:5-methylcytosine-specific restriction endonuclease McrA